MVIMDGQGNLNDQAIISSLQLTNIVLINFNFSEFNEVDPHPLICICNRHQRTQVFEILQSHAIAL